MKNVIKYSVPIFYQEEVNGRRLREKSETQVKNTFSIFDCEYYYIHEDEIKFDDLMRTLYVKST